MKHLFALLLLLSHLALPQAAEQRHVLLITIDGFPAFMLTDPKTPIPRIRQLAAEGVVAEGLRMANPTVTWPNHTTLVTGVAADRHSVLFNGILVREGPGLPVRIDPRRDKSELVATPTVFDLLHGRGYRTAAINWPCTRNSRTLDDDFPDSPEPLSHTTPRLLKEMIAQGILPSDDDALFRAMTGPARDEVWTQAASHVIRARKPHLMLFHLLNIDGIHHRYGAQSPASYTALALADTMIGRVLDDLDAAGIRSRTTIFLTADHGFETATNILQPNVLLRRAGLLELGANNQVVRARAQALSQGGIALVYLTNPDTREADRQQALDLFRGKDGIAEILLPDQYAAHGLPAPAENQGMADLVLAARDGYAFSATATGEDFLVQANLQSSLGYHGYLARNPKMNGAFIAAGHGIRRAAKTGLVESIDIAPTIAHLFGEKLPSAKGKVLHQLLANE